MKKFLLAALMVLCAAPVWAGGAGPSKTFKSIAVLDGGRVKPMDTFARSFLTQISGKDHFGKMDGSQWLATLLFDPEKTIDDRVFLINNPDTAIAIGLSVDPHRRYTARQLREAYRKLAKLQEQARAIPEKERTLVENELLRVFDNINMYADLSRSFIPVIPAAQDKPWLTPGDAGSMSAAKNVRDLLALWTYMGGNFQAGQRERFDAAAQAFATASAGMVTGDQLAHVRKFPLEMMYHAASPFTWAIVFYIMAFLSFVASFASSRALWHGLALAGVGVGFAVHTLGLIARIIIMARPPVSSLYETFIFVGFITVFLGLLIERRNAWLGIVTASISGTALLFIANKYSAEGDTLKMLIAVLNSNFWLATHVTTIAMGYGATCVAGILGHVWLVQAAAGKDTATLQRTYRTTMGVLGLALTLTFLGTNLGGVWADQSWGRFWGWDPKENGALMIVLWVAMLMHAKAGNMINEMGLAAGAVLGMIVVMWAWFGVNLLSVGLHSYGFTAGIATNLLIYVVLELVFLVLTMVLASRRPVSPKI